MKVVLDTSAIYAFLSADDDFHNSAREVFGLCSQLLMSFSVFEELLALRHHRKGKKEAIEIIKKIRQSKIIKVIYFDEKEGQQIERVYEEAKSGIDYVDASVMWLSKKLDLPVFTFDSHFKKEGFEVVPEF